MKGIRKALVCVNGSLDVVHHGIRLARDEKTWVTVLKVVPPYEGDINLTGIKNLSDIFNSGSEKDASDIKKLAQAEGALIKARVEEGEIDKKIVEVALEERCDIIIMGAQKKSLWNRLIGRNIVEKVVGQAPCPVLVV